MNLAAIKQVYWNETGIKYWFRVNDYKQLKGSELDSGLSEQAQGAHISWIHDTDHYGHLKLCCGFPGSLVVKNLPANAGDVGLIPGLGRSPGEGSGNLLQPSGLKNSMGRGAWWATVHGIAKESNTT